MSAPRGSQNDLANEVGCPTSDLPLRKMSGVFSVKPASRRMALKAGLITVAEVLTATSVPFKASARTLEKPITRFFIPEDPTTIGPPPAQVAVHEGSITVPGGSLFYWDTRAAGPAVLLLHPLTGSAQSWPYQRPAFTEAGLRVVAFSSRGAYRSAGPPGHAVDDVKAIADALGISTFHVVGSAAGAFTALRFALAYPSRVRSLTLSCSLCGVSEPSYLALMKSIQVAAFDALPSEVKELSASYRAANPNGVRRWLEIEAHARSAGTAGTARSLSLADRAKELASGPAFADLARLDLPVHLLYGDADLYAPPAFGRILARQFRRADLSIIGETGHSAFWEQPNVFNRAVIDFIRRHTFRAG